MDNNLTQNNSSKIKGMKNQVIAIFFDFMIWSYFCLASYKIIYQQFILQMRHPVFSWNEPLFSLIPGFFLAVIFSILPDFSLGKILVGMEIKKKKKLSSRPIFFLSIIVFFITLICGIYFSQVSIVEFFSSSGLSGAKRIFVSLFNPNFAIIEDAIFAAIETIFMAFIATCFAIPIAFIISFAAARNIMKQSKFLFLIYSFCRFVLNGVRSIEPLVWAIIFSVWVGIGPFSGMLALCLHSIAALTKLYSEQIENVEEGPIEAITATGAHPIQVIWFGIVPQIILPFLSFTIYRWDINVRMATVIGLVGGGGIGTMLMQYQGRAMWNEVGLLVIIIGIIVWIMDYSSSKIRERIK